VLKPDVNFAEAYQHMQPDETGKSKGDLTERDTASWKPKSLVVELSLARIHGHMTGKTSFGCVFFKMFTYESMPSASRLTTAFPRNA